MSIAPHAPPFAHGTHPWRLSLALAALLTVTATGRLAAQERTSSHRQPLQTRETVELWTAERGQVPVCWETAGFPREKRVIRAALAGTWEQWANVNFVGFGTCPTSGETTQVRVRIVTQDTSNAGGGGNARVGRAALSTASDGARVNLSFMPDSGADLGRVEYIAVHEFGHVLGFEHEQDSPANEGPAKCTSGVGSSVGIKPLSPYDRNSVMNYCNADRNMTGNLTDGDIVGVQAAYGVRRPYPVMANSCASAARRGRSSVAAAWNDRGAASVAVYPSTGTAFLGHQQRSIRNGGWGDEVRWVSGDFDGDGVTDIAAAWNNGGKTTLTVRLARGMTFTPEHWQLDAGGWMNSTTWVAGDFDGDKRDDLAGIWNDAGQTSIAVYRSDGRQFLYRAQWSQRDGGWGPDVKWFAGDFDGDGRADVGAAWNNAERTTLTVRRSTGSGFVPAHWLVDAGRWTTTSTFVGADVTGDGRADVLELWNDIGQNSIRVARSTGAGFGTATAWATRDGGVPWFTKWVPGDFDGDGRVDLLAVWDNGGTNTLTVRRSVGSTFTAAHWAQGAGGWMSTTAWCAGDYGPRLADTRVRVTPRLRLPGGP